MEKQEQQNKEQSSEQTRTDQQVRTTKWLAVFGFLALIITLAWFLFTALAFIPNLVSMVGSVFSTEPETTTPVEVVLTPSQTTAIHDESLTLSWESPTSQPGSYAIWFACVDDVTVSVVTPDDGLQQIACDTYYNIGDRTSLNAIFNSPTTEATDIRYEVAFVPEDENGEQSGSVGTLTIENPELAVRDNEDETTTEEEPEVPVEDAVDTTDRTTETPRTPQYRQEIVYGTPQSDPHGVTDLDIRFSRVGTLENGTFLTTGSFDRGEPGAIRFTVTNNGTRTSEVWQYSAQLPNGQTYTSPQQTPLRPNETATISLGFRAPSEAGGYPFSVQISTSRDVTRSNHAFSWNVAVE